MDLGGGSGKLSNYFIQKGFKSICYDFSENMRKYANENFPNISFILDDILNIKNHFRTNSIEGITAMYTLFHIPKENINQLFMDINSVLKENGLFCFSLQLGNGEKFVDEPYLKEKGKNVLYMNYFTRNQIYDLLSKSNFDIIYKTEKHETGDNVIGEDGNDAIYIIAKKRKWIKWQTMMESLEKSYLTGGSEFKKTTTQSAEKSTFLLKRLLHIYKKYYCFK